VRLPKLQGARLQDRIVLFFVALLIAVQLASFFFIRYAIEQTARSTMREELRAGSQVFLRLLHQNSQQLVEATSVLTYDAAFRDAIAGRDRDTIAAALRNHAARINASGMAVIGLDRTVVADTLVPANAGRPYPDPALMDRAAALGRTSAMRIIEGRLYQVVLVPVLAPRPIAWVSMDFAIDDRTARDLQRLTTSDISFVSTGGARPELLATTLPATRRGDLLQNATNIVSVARNGAPVSLGGEPYEVLATPVDTASDLRIFAVQQRSLAEGIAPYLMLQAALLFIAALSVAVTLFGAMRIARRVTSPLRQLSHAAGEITRGNYNVRIGSRTNDEIGELSRAFDGMAQGLAERDNIRGVLGKVASSEVVKQLLDGEIELGGQELDATVMFTDIRNFTALCEKLTPRQSLQLLNEFLTSISAVIEEHEGVVDKYMGDGVMAVFGAPVTRPDDPQRAIEAALDIRNRIDRLRPQLAARGMPHPEVGVGLNTSRVVGGNVGSPSRLNYTVLGDGVNLASRLEGLTKRYHVPIVCGNRTHDIVSGIVFRELDKVRVKGKTVPERIFEPLGREGQLPADKVYTLERWHEALAMFRERRWIDARAEFNRLGAEPGYGRLTAIYLGYVRDLLANPPGDEWDAAFTLYEK
jgi:adenylate cyclase